MQPAPPWSLVWATQGAALAACEGREDDSCSVVLAWCRRGGRGLEISPGTALALTDKDTETQKGRGVSTVTYQGFGTDPAAMQQLCLRDCCEQGSVLREADRHVPAGPHARSGARGWQGEEKDLELEAGLSGTSMGPSSSFRPLPCARPCVALPGRQSQDTGALTLGDRGGKEQAGEGEGYVIGWPRGVRSLGACAGRWKRVPALLWGTLEGGQPWPGMASG